MKRVIQGKWTSSAKAGEKFAVSLSEASYL